MCLPPATRTGGEIRKSPAKAESWSGQRLEAGKRQLRVFCRAVPESRACRRGGRRPRFRGGACEPRSGALQQDSPGARGEGKKRSASAGRQNGRGRPSSGMRAAGRLMRLLRPRFSTETDGRKGTPFPLGTLAQTAAWGYGKQALFARRAFLSTGERHGLPFLLRRHHCGDLRPYLYQENVSQQTSLIGGKRRKRPRLFRFLSAFRQNGGSAVLCDVRAQERRAFFFSLFGAL